MKERRQSFPFEKIEIRNETNGEKRVDKRKRHNHENGKTGFAFPRVAWKGLRLKRSRGNEPKYPV